MAALFDPLTENLYTASYVSTGVAFVWLLTFLVQYLFFRYWRARVRADDELRRVALLETETELSETRRDRTMNRLENHILREFVSQADIERSIALLMRRYVPNQRDGFCAIVQFLEDDEVVLNARGLSHVSQSSMEFGSTFRNRLDDQRQIVLEEQGIADSCLLDNLSRDDRGKARKLHVIANSDDSDLSLAMLTTKLYPKGGTLSQQMELANRLVTSISRSLLQMQSFQSQQDELRATNERMTLRSIADRNFESPAEMMKEFLAALLKMVKADRIAFFLSQSEKEDERTAMCRCGIELQPGARVRWQLHEQRIVEVSCAELSVQEYDRKQLAQVGVGTLIGRAIVIPVRREGAATAHICCTRSRADAFTKSERELMSWAAGHLAETIQRWLSFVHVERQAKRDGLTDLANRREFDERIGLELQRIANEGGRLSLLLFDLDNFKMVNDTHGHQAGDYVLKKCARVVNESLSQTRVNDRVLVARYGGEEIAVLLPEVPEPGAARIAESIRAAIEQTRFLFNDTVIPITISAGVGMARGDTMTAGELIGATDAALYAAKELGRNQVIRATELTIRLD